MTTDDLPRPIPWLEAAAAPSASAVLEVSAPLSSVSVGSAVVAAVGARAGTAPKRHLPIVGGMATSKRAPKKRPGSGIPPRKIIVGLVWARRASQALFLALFLALLCGTAFRGSFAASGDAAVRLPYPVEAFLLADPLVALVTLLATHEVYAGLAWSLAVVMLTLVVGRAFCGWICPFGTLHHVLGWLLPGPKQKGMARVKANQSAPWQRYKYYGLTFFLGAAATGSVIAGMFDPICVMVRGVGLGLMPILQYVGLRGLDELATHGGRSGQVVADHAATLLGEHVFPAEPAYFHQGWLVSALFFAVLFANRVVPRFFCRALCPLGALLGVLSRFAIFGMEKDHSKCTDCNLCLTDCQGADSPQGGVKHQREECHLCFNCEAACPEDVIRFRFFPGLRSLQDRPDLARRSTLLAASAGALTVPMARVANWPDRGYSEKVIRPPGAVAEREFLERCIRCSECMKVCPNNALHPAFFEAGPEGLWTPILIPRIGYCEHSCVLCGQVCPTGAIQKIEERHKLGIGTPPISIGTAMFDRGRCLPWAMATPCTVCEEFCPTSPKAIWLEEVSVPKRGRVSEAGAELTHEMITVRRPHVDPSLCIGCGACEKVCPVVDRPAVYVTSAGESRSKTNVILLEDSAYGPS